MLHEYYKHYVRHTIDDISLQGVYGNNHYISLSDIKFQEKIGYGASSIVYRAVIKDNIIVAVKVNRTYPSRHSSSSLSVLSIRSRENGSISRPFTIVHSPPAVVTGKP